MKHKANITLKQAKYDNLFLVNEVNPLPTEITISNETFDPSHTMIIPQLPSVQACIWKPSDDMGIGHVMSTYEWVCSIRGVQWI